MVHWKRDLDLYTIGRPLERNAGFWLNYMKGLKGEREDSRRIPSVPCPSVGSHPYWAETPTRRDLMDPRFGDPLGAAGIAHSAEFDDLRDIMARANRRRRQQEIDDQRRALGLYP
ncbi:uncharacterized protein LOC119114573 isoform X2 [Pollicipes pollicipes]|uniref:uncharacterized protein LOC119114573 isoform X2 n=1 Tax=Pollicipes pollicipes TaxID=41117 RepID=UPI001884AE94|nr:uncharacterized protein LOC119114573 isoform X2 [Pollicipes pollicipes]